MATFCRVAPSTASWSEELVSFIVPSEARSSASSVDAARRRSTPRRLETGKITLAGCDALPPVSVTITVIV
jgi:hypothetical protein